MTVLVTGADGQLGYDIYTELKKQNTDCVRTDRHKLDITCESSVQNVIKDIMPDMVIHCAAYTAVDRAEDEKESCYNVNVNGTKYIAQACKDIDAVMVYISTDYVFDGMKEQPYQIDDLPNPLNQYGLTKFEGENIVKTTLSNFFIIRTSWVFGIHGNNFLKTIINLSKSQTQLNIIDDQIGSPTYSKDLASSIIELIKTNKFGIYHITNEGFASWAELAEFMFQTMNIDIKINKISTDDYITKAMRPKNSRLSKESLYKAGLDKLPLWQDAVTRFCEAMREKGI